MANTYTQIYIQVVFSVKRRRKLIRPEWQDRINRYIAGIVKKLGHIPLKVNGVENHIHIFILYKPHQSLSDLVRIIKTNSCTFIKVEYPELRHTFSWQVGYGAFSYHPKISENVISYIDRQQEHHELRKFEQEYHELMIEYEIDFDEKYLYG